MSNLCRVVAGSLQPVFVVATTNQTKVLPNAAFVVVLTTTPPVQSHKPFFISIPMLGFF